MRAGQYAVVHGVAYDLVRYQGYEDAPLRVRAPGDQPCPPGFSRSGGGWERRVVPEEITEMFQVVTTARCQGRPVIVTGVSRDDAFITYIGPEVSTDPELAHLRRGPRGEVSAMVKVEDLTEVIEQTVALPVPPPGSSWLTGTVRAGLYAVVEGVTYRADRGGASHLWLLLPRAEVAPPWFEQLRSGRWRRKVVREEVTALFYVETTARWKGHPVRVHQVLGEHAQIEYIGEDIDGRPELQYEPHGIWRGTVEVQALTHVIQLPRDVPW